VTAKDPFALVREALESAGVRYAVSGSWASTAFGEPRYTNDIDIVVEFSQASLDSFLAALPASFYVDFGEARRALLLGRSFNAIYTPMMLKFDFFQARSYPLGLQELDRATPLAGTGLCDLPTPFVTPEDVLLAKLNWFRQGGEVSDSQWRDIRGIVRMQRDHLDREYLDRGAETLRVTDLLDKALNE